MPGADPYTDPDTGILRNLLGITEPEDLARVEGQVTTLRIAVLHEDPEPGNYDLPHLQRIHARIFDGLYEWAGDVRTVDIGKSNAFFCPAFRIPEFAGQVFSGIQRGQALRAQTPEQTIARLPRHLAEVDALHPFREGNGRATRAFFSQWAADGGVDIDWTDLDPERKVHAYQQAFRGNLEPLTEMIREITTPTPNRGHDLGPGHGHDR